MPYTVVPYLYSWCSTILKIGHNRKLCSYGFDWSLKGMCLYIHTYVATYSTKNLKKNYSYFNIFIFKYVHTYILVRKEKIINISNILWSNLNYIFIFLYVAFFIIDDTHKNKIIVHFSQTIVVRCFFYFEIVYYRVFLYSIFF